MSPSSLPPPPPPPPPRQAKRISQQEESTSVNVSESSEHPASAVQTTEVDQSSLNGAGDTKRAIMEAASRVILRLSVKIQEHTDSMYAPKDDFIVTVISSSSSYFGIAAYLVEIPVLLSRLIPLCT